MHALGFSLAILVVAAVFVAPANDSAQATTGFITRQGAQLMNASTPFRFVGFNIPDALYNEYPWAQVDAGEQADLIASVAQSGATVARTMPISIKNPSDNSTVKRHLTCEPSRF